MSSTFTLERPKAAPVKAPPAPPAKPVRLEVNRQGQWQAVALFDAASQDQEDAMCNGVVALASLDPYTAFRVVTMDDLRIVLLTYSHASGWLAGE